MNFCHENLVKWCIVHRQCPYLLICEKLPFALGDNGLKQSMHVENKLKWKRNILWLNYKLLRPFVVIPVVMFLGFLGGSLFVFIRSLRWVSIFWLKHAFLHDNIYIASVLNTKIIEAVSSLRCYIRKHIQRRVLLEIDITDTSLMPRKCCNKFDWLVYETVTFVGPQ